MAALGTDVPWWPSIFGLRQTTADVYLSDPIHSGLPRPYGGQLGAQSLLAAAATVAPDRIAHSLQISFLHPGVEASAITYSVDRGRDSRSMSTRVVTADQGGRILATCVASFHTVPSGATRASIEHEWQPDGGPGRSVPDPDECPSRSTSLSDRYGADIPSGSLPHWPIELRYVDHVPWSDSAAPPRNRIWLRSIDYPRHIAGADLAVLAFATDLPMFEPVYFPAGIAWHDVVGHTALLGATLNHSVWMHRPGGLDDWLLLEQLAPVAHGYRAFCRGELRTRAGQLVASVAQEMVFVTPRPRRPESKRQMP